jgi:hypothetical protein
MLPVEPSKTMFFISQNNYWAADEPGVRLMAAADQCC